MVLLKPRANEHTLRTDDILEAIRVRAPPLRGGCVRLAGGGR